MKNDVIRLLAYSLVAASLISAAIVLINKNEKAATYVCYYGQFVRDPSIAPYLQNDPLYNPSLVPGLNKSVNDIQCHTSVQPYNFTCPVWYDKTEYTGDVLFSPSEE